MRYLALFAIGCIACSKSDDTTEGAGGSTSSSSQATSGAAQGSGGQGGSAPVCSDHVLDCDGLEGCETDILVDAENCGGCGHACEPGPHGAPACVDASCALECDAGFADCNGIVSDGCETDPLTSVWNCGGCGNMCLETSNSTPGCEAGNCVNTCDAGFADCNGDPSDGCEVSLAFDSLHCGACNNACPAENGTALCGAGHCAVEITSGVGDIRDIAVSGGFVYFAATGVYRVPLSGGTPQLVGSGGIGTTAALALSGSSVYFIHNTSNARGLFAVPMSGGTATQVAALNPNVTWAARRLAADSSTAYWIDYFNLTSVPLAGGTPVTWGDASAWGGPAIAGSALYWTAGANHGDIYTMPLGGGTVTTLLDAFGPYDTIAVASGFAYASAFSTLERVSLSGGTPQLLASGLDPTYYMATDGLHVYLYSNGGNSQGEIVRVPAAGGTPDVMANVSYPSLNRGAIAVDGTHVYWAMVDKILKTPK